MDHNFGQFYNYLAYLSTIKYGTVRDIKLSPNQFSFLYKKKAKSSQLKCVVFLPTQFRFVFFFQSDDGGGVKWYGGGRGGNAGK